MPPLDEEPAVAAPPTGPRLAYPDAYHPWMLPRRVIGRALLAGAPAPELTGLRVLDVGCARGRNLVTIAGCAPDARCVGVDVDASALERARALAEAAGLRNVIFLDADMAALTPASLAASGAPTAFDLVLIHNVLSFVDEAKGDAILASAARLLAPDGLCLVSFNALPAWAAHGVLREAARWFTAASAQKADRASKARGVLARLCASKPSDTDAPTVAGAVGRFLHEEAKRTRESLEAVPEYADAFVEHELLADDVSGAYLADVLARLQRHGLHAVADGGGTLSAARLSPRRRAPFEALGQSEVHRERIRDIVEGCYLRTLLVAKAPPPPESVVPASDAVVIALSDDASSEAEMLARELEDRGPLERALLAALVAAENDEHRLDVAALAAHGEGATPGALRRALLALARDGMIFVEGPGGGSLPAVEPGVRPVAWPVARAFAAVENEMPNRRGEPARLDAVMRILVPLMDGSRDVPALADALRRALPEAAAAAVTDEVIAQGIELLVASELLVPEASS